MSFVRTFGTLSPSKHVVGVVVKVTAEGPAAVTDIQLVPGSSLFSWSPQVGDLDLKADMKWRYVNGMIMSDFDSWIMSDEDNASPYRSVMYPSSTQDVAWNMLDIGRISAKHTFNGYDYTISSGVGITPHLTARADQRTGITTTGIMSALIGIKGIHDTPPPLDPTDDGTVVDAHTGGWGSVLGWHETWNDVLVAHGEWS